MEKRTHKLLVMVGEEGAQFEARDYRKLSEVIVSEYLAQDDSSFRNYLLGALGRAIRSIPLKAHFYAALTADISRAVPTLAPQIFESVISGLESDLQKGRLSQALNALNFLSESMNVLLFNSLALVDLLGDLLDALQKQSDQQLQQALLQVLLRALPLCAASLTEKVYHDFRKLLERIRKIAGNDPLYVYIYGQFQANSSKNRSNMARLGCDFGGLAQFQSKVKLQPDFSTAKEKKYPPIQYYKWEEGEEQYQEYCKGEGCVQRGVLQHLIDCFEDESELLTGKLNNWVSAQNEPFFLRNMVQSLTLRGLRCKRPIIESSLLLSLKKNIGESAGRLINYFLGQIFASSEGFELSVIINLANMVSFIAANWKEAFDWQPFLQGEGSFLKRTVLLRLTLQKLISLNSKMALPSSLSNYEPPAQTTNLEEYSSTQQLQVFEELQEALKTKQNAEQILKIIPSEHSYGIFLEALFRRMSVSQTHLSVLEERYHYVLVHFKEHDWDLINKIRNFFKNSFLRRLHYLRFMISRGALSFASYINYVGQLRGKSDIDMTWVKLELHELNGQFGETLKSK